MAGEPILLRASNRTVLEMLKSTAPAPAESIPVLEKKLDSLRSYANTLHELSLVDAHSKAMDKIRELQEQVTAARHVKAEALVRSLGQEFQIWRISPKRKLGDLVTDSPTMSLV